MYLQQMCCLSMAARAAVGVIACLQAPRRAPCRGHEAWLLSLGHYLSSALTENLVHPGRQQKLSMRQDPLAGEKEPQRSLRASKSQEHWQAGSLPWHQGHLTAADSEQWAACLAAAISRGDRKA